MYYIIKKILFTDYTKIFKSISNLINLKNLQTDIYNLVNWCRKNGMTLNTETYSSITFCLKKYINNSIYFIYLILI